MHTAKTKFIFINECGEIKVMTLFDGNTPRAIKINRMRPVEIFVLGPVSDYTLHKVLNYCLHPTKRKGITHFTDYENYKDSSVEELRAWSIIDGTRF